MTPTQPRQPETVAERRLTETDRRIVRQQAVGIRERVRQYGAATTYHEELIAALMDFWDASEDAARAEAFAEIRRGVETLAAPSSFATDAAFVSRAAVLALLPSVPPEPKT